MGLRDKGSLWSIRLDIFVSGAVVMALEMMGSRLLAPVFGDSVFVWGSLIGVVMASLALGYYLGGRLADREPSFRAFSLLIFAAGVLIIPIPLFSNIVLEAVLYSGLGERYGPVLASLLLLAAPTTLLGMVSPYAIRLAASSLQEIGGVSGSLYSVSTGGSIFGTFFTVFVLIPSFGVRVILISLGVVLIAVSIIGMAREQRLITIFILVVVLMLPSTPFIGESLSIFTGTVVYRRDTAYNSLTVVDNPNRGTRILYLNNMPHSACYINGSNRAVFRYTDYFNLGFVLNPEIGSVLFIGGGGFSGPKQFLEYYPDVTVDVVEIDPVVVDTAWEYFGVPDDPRLRVYVGDGRAFLGRLGTYDLIVLDAYSKTYVPFHLMTREFFEALAEHLNPDGVVVSNLVSSLLGDTSNLLMAEVKTVGEVFPQVYLFPTKDLSLSWVQNIILVATEAPSRYGKDDLLAMALDAPVRGETLAVYCGNLFDREIDMRDSPLLTDDYAPTEMLLNPVTNSPYRGG
jgi:spermidine synthase